MAEDSRPALAAPQGQTKDDRPQTIGDFLKHEQTVRKFQQVVPRHLNAERMLRVMAQAVFNVPKLGQCHPITLLGAMMACASLGLEPNTPLGLAYLIPFEKRKFDNKTKEWVTDRVDVNLIIGYRGYIDLARRSGTLVSIHADVVYGATRGQAADEFSFEYGSNMHLRHVPQGQRGGDRPKLYAYAHASLKDGQAFEVLPYAEILRLRDGTEAYKTAMRAIEKASKETDERKRAYAVARANKAPWIAYEHPMAAKSMIRSIAKMLPMSIEFANAALLDQMSEVGKVDFAQFAGGVDISDDISQALIEHSEEESIDVLDEGREGERQTVQNEARTRAPRGKHEDKQTPPTSSQALSGETTTTQAPTTTEAPTTRQPTSSTTQAPASKPAAARRTMFQD